MLPPQVEELARLFSEERPLYLVGGAVRDALLGRIPQDFDFTTAAEPAEVKAIVRNWADQLWTVGERFGTIAVEKGGYKFEITTFRSEVYDDTSRKPEVSYSGEIREDLIRRDFTVNAMAWDILKRELIDDFSGREHLVAELIKTPGPVEVSFTDDPLRMLRALRYHATLEFRLDEDVLLGIARHGELLKKVSIERISDEFSKMLVAERPSSALRLLYQTGLCMHFLPELAEMDMPQPTGFHHKDVLEHTLQVVDSVSPELIVRLAALFHDVAKPRTRQIIGGTVHFYHHESVGAQMSKRILKRLRFSNQIRDAVYQLVDMHLRPASYRDGAWTDSAVRRYIRDAGELLDRLNELASADCTSLNPRVARAAWEGQKELEFRIEKVRAEEDLNAIRPYVDGTQIMEAFDLKPGPEVGRLRKALLDAQIDGEIADEDAAWEFLRALINEDKGDEPVG